MKKPKQDWRETTIVVEGRGTFPYDMLRYDSCCPARGADALIMMDTNSPARDSRTVRLRRYSGDATPATALRWASFGWSVQLDSAMGDVI